MEQDFLAQVLEALVSGYLARGGTKERFRSLTEYEIARRAGIVSCSYVEYDGTPERVEVRAALGTLEQQGLVSFVRPSGRYDAFAPTTRGTATVSPQQAELMTDAGPQEIQGSGAPSTSAASEMSQANIERKLDEIIALLRSIEQRLGRPDPSSS